MLVLDLSLQAINTTLILPESDQFTDYVFAKNYYWTGNFFRFPDMGGLGPVSSSYPIAITFDSRKWILIAVLIKLGFSSVAAVNLGLILSFALVSTAMLLLLRFLKVELWLALAISFVFTFIPWHMLRLVHGFTFADYSVVPAVIYLILFMTSYILQPSGYQKISKRNGAKILGVSVWICTSGAYYIFFSVILLLLAFSFLMLKNYFRVPEILREKNALFLMMGGFFISSLLIQFVYWKFGNASASNLEPTPKSIVDFFNYGLLPFTLFLPITSDSTFFTIDRISNSLYGYRPQSFCLEDHTNNGIMKLTCSVNFESSAFLSLSAVLLTSLSLLIIINYLTPITFKFRSIKKLVGPNFLDSKNQDAQIYLNTSLSNIQQSTLSFLFLSSMAIASIGGLGIFIASIYPGFRAYGRISIFVLGISCVMVAIESKRFVKRTLIRFFSMFLLIAALVNSSIFMSSFRSYDNLNVATKNSVLKFSQEFSQPCTILVLPVVSSFFPFEKTSQRSNGQFPYMGAMFYANSDKLRYDSGLTNQHSQINSELFSSTLPSSQFYSAIRRNYCGFIFVGNQASKNDKINILIRSSKLIDKRKISLNLQNYTNADLWFESYKFTD